MARKHGRFYEHCVMYEYYFSPDLISHGHSIRQFVTYDKARLSAADLASRFVVHLYQEKIPVDNVKRILGMNEFEDELFEVDTVAELMQRFVFPSTTDQGHNRQLPG